MEKVGGAILKLLHTSHNRVLIDRIKSTLDEAEIVYIVRNEKLVGQAAGEVPPAVCWPEIFVRNEEDFEEAKQLINRLSTVPTSSHIAWICPNCSERLEPQFEICWSCQSERTPA